MLHSASCIKKLLHFLDLKGAQKHLLSQGAAIYYTWLRLW